MKVLLIKKIKEQCLTIFLINFQCVHFYKLHMFVSYRLAYLVVLCILNAQFIYYFLLQGISAILKNFGFFIHCLTVS